MVNIGMYVIFAGVRVRTLVYDQRINLRPFNLVKKLLGKLSNLPMEKGCIAFKAEVLHNRDILSF
jgi:hypothetical protein